MATLAAACSSSGPEPQGSEPGAPPLDEHHIPASQVAVPEHVTWAPPPVVEPPNPILHAPPLHNPGGVNGTRAERRVIGIVSGTATQELKTIAAPPPRQR